MSPSENEEISMNGLLCAAGFSLMAFFASCGVGARVEQSHAVPVAFTATAADTQWIVGK
jgi:hypothetical protein